QRRTPAAQTTAGQTVGFHPGMVFQRAVHDLAQLADALAVNDPDSSNPAPTAFLHVFQDHVLHVARPKGMQVQDTVHGQLHRVRNALAFIPHRLRRRRFGAGIAFRRIAA
ncbi:hypothetical protein RZS08_03785, partial [Arthrospira platensis SPKY1]|nr:hypothetical protein [Arthrospira platensis SPKY1]